MELRDLLLFFLISGFTILAFMLFRKIRQFRSGPKEPEGDFSENIRKLMNKAQDEGLMDFDKPPADE